MDVLDALRDAGLQPLAGGWSGETFVAEVGGERQVVRIHGRDPGRAEVDAALVRLVRGLVPVPEVLEARNGDPEAGTPGLLVTAWVEGERGDLVVPDLHGAARTRLAAAVGRLAATLAGMPMTAPGGFADGTLRIEPWHLDDGLPGFVDDHLPRLHHWTAGERAGLAAVAAEAQGVLDTVARHCLVHSDLNPKNWLVDPDTLEVAALLDWEYAHAGHPFTDLGNALRFERDPVWTDGVLGAFADVRGTPPVEALALARAADLWALVDLAVRRGSSPVADRAHDLLRGVAGAGDAGWTP